MQIAFAPMEGITDDIFRTLHHRFFPGVDRYYTPFLSPVTEGPPLTPRDLRQVLPENNPDIVLVPQLLTNRASAFLRGAEKLRELGYKEVNLNLGCPSGTVTAKGKGAGFLQNPQALETFLDEIFSAAPLKISIKTRLGMERPEEFYALLELFNRYPVSELILHPRVRQDFYRKPVRMAYFHYAREHSAAPLCLSGGVAVASDLAVRFPEGNEPARLMLGRGLAADPALAARLKGIGTLERSSLEAFHGQLFEAVCRRAGSPRNAMFHMKELWSYLILMFDNRERLAKQLRKAVSLSEYHIIVTHIFRDLPLRESADPQWERGTG